MNSEINIVQIKKINFFIKIHWSKKTGLNSRPSKIYIIKLIKEI